MVSDRTTSKRLNPLCAWLSWRYVPAKGVAFFLKKKLFPTGVWVVLSVVAGFSLRGSVVVTGRCVCLARVALLAGATSGQVCGMTVPLSLMVRGGG